MTSWQQLLLLHMAQGKYLNLSSKPVTEHDWLVLWGLIQTEQWTIAV